MIQPQPIREKYSPAMQREDRSLDSRIFERKNPGSRKRNVQHLCDGVGRDEMQVEDELGKPNGNTKQKKGMGRYKFCIPMLFSFEHQIKNLKGENTE